METIFRKNSANHHKDVGGRYGKLGVLKNIFDLMTSSKIVDLCNFYSVLHKIRE